MTPTSAGRRTRSWIMYPDFITCPTCARTEKHKARENAQSGLNHEAQLQGVLYTRTLNTYALTTARAHTRTQVCNMHTCANTTVLSQQGLAGGRHNPPTLHCKPYSLNRKHGVPRLRGPIMSLICPGMSLIHRNISLIVPTHAIPRLPCP